MLRDRRECATVHNPVADCERGLAPVPPSPAETVHADEGSLEVAAVRGLVQADVRC